MSAYTDLAEAFAHGNDAQPALWPHLVRRMSALVGTEHVFYAEASRETVSSGVASGVAIVLTDKRVVQAEFTDTPVDMDPQAPDDGTATVVVTCWPRSSLKAIEINGKTGEWNTDAAWSQQDTDQWPANGRVTLRYAGRKPALRLPLSKSTAPSSSLADVVTSLLHDLDASL